MQWLLWFIPDEDQDYLTYMQGGLMALGSTVLLGLSSGEVILKMIGGTGLRKQFSTAFHEFNIRSKGFVLAVVALVVDILAQVGLFIYEWVSGDVKFGSVEWGAMFAG